MSCHIFRDSQGRRELQRICTGSDSNAVTDIRIIMNYSNPHLVKGLEDGDSRCYSYLWTIASATVTRVCHSKKGPFQLPKHILSHIPQLNSSECGILHQVSLTGVNYEVCLNGTHCCVPLERMGNSTPISKWDERAVHLADPHCNIFDPLRQTSKSLVGGFAWTPAWEALNITISTNLQRRAQLNREGGGGVVSTANITTIVQSL